MHVGVVGTGIAGLTAAWLLHRTHVAVTVFEKQSRIGLDAQSVDFEFNGELIRCDVPPRMFNELLWPNLSRLYGELGIETESVEASKTFASFEANPASNQRDQTVYLKTRNSYLPKLSSSLLLNSTTRTICKDIKRMLATVPSDLEHPLDMTMGEYLRMNQYSSAFVDKFLFPALASTVCTCRYASLEAYPAEVLLAAMLKLTLPGGLQRTRFGTQDVARRLTSGLNDIRLGTSVTNITQTRSDASVKTSLGERMTFDHVIVATQANSAQLLLDSEMRQEHEMLRQFRYEKIPVVLHSDRRLMPARTRNWSSFNLLSTTERTAMCSIWMNRFAPEWGIDLPVFQTIMPLLEPRAELVLGTAKMQRPVVDRDSLRGLELMSKLHSEPDRRVWFCGSYASPGIPLLESGVVSSIKVAEKIGVRWPTECQV